MRLRQGTTAWSWLLCSVLIVLRGVTVHANRAPILDSYDHLSDKNNASHISIDPEDGFTMIIATYNRDQLLPDLINHLTINPPQSLRQILFVWQNVDRPLPPLLQADSLETLSTRGVVVSVRQSKRNSMNERFRPELEWGEEIPTRTVMIVDDDVVLRKDSLEWGFQHFKLYNEQLGQQRIVGFAGRDYETLPDGTLDYVVQPRFTYSMVLSNAAWLSRDWLYAYWADTPLMTRMRDYVDEVFNCDDLLVNFLVTNMTHQPPLLLQPRMPLRTIPTDGLWNRNQPLSENDKTPDAEEAHHDEEEESDATDKPDHFLQRPKCLERFFNEFSQFAPNETKLWPEHSRFPLMKTSTTISQDVIDHARWLYPGEPWEPDEMTPPETDEEKAEREKREFADMVANLSDEEKQDFMESVYDDEDGEWYQSLFDSQGHDEEYSDDEIDAHERRPRRDEL
ncbi:hypothetical protein OIO90_002066 [Microbotryomycetes sp. JL221]|nr:hypothetical protein OIO90_002066 [Microbotryomycetes sp. JL221]